MGTLGTLVLIKDHIPCLQWPRGDVVKIYPGEDKVTRVASIKTSTGTFKRALTKLSPLPLDEEKEIPVKQGQKK